MIINAVNSYDIRTSADMNQLIDNFTFCDSLNETWLNPGSNLDPVPANQRKQIRFAILFKSKSASFSNFMSCRLSYPSEMGGQLLFVAIQAVDDNSNPSLTSNVATVYLDKYVETTPPNPPTPPTKGLSGGEIAGIVIGSLAGVFLITAGAYFGYNKYQKSKQ